MTPIRILALIFALGFFGVVGASYVPGWTNAQGQLLGLFHIDPIDNVLHGGSAIWALLAGLTSTLAASRYFRIFGPVYFGDAICGLLTGQGYLDGGIFTIGPTALDMSTRVLTNLPHVVIGGSAVLIGYVFLRWLTGRGANAALQA